MDKKYLVVKEVAYALGLEQQTVRDYISSGRLKSEKIYNSTVVSKEEVNKYIKEMKNKEVI